jgi:hypothetical protein
MSNPNSVSTLGLWPGAVLEAKDGGLKGSRMVIIEGDLPPCSFTLTKPTRGPYVNIDRIDRIPHRTRIMITHPGIVVRFLFLNGPHYKKNMLKYEENRVTQNNPVELAMHDKTLFKAFKGFDTSVWSHDVPAVGQRYSGPAFIMDKMSATREYEGVGTIHLFDGGAVIPPATDGCDIEINEYCERVLMYCGLSDPSAIRCLHVLKTAPADDIIEILANTIRARPREVILPEGTPVSIDRFHAAAATIILFSGISAFRNGAALSGSARYALTVGSEIRTHHCPYAIPYAALRLASKDPVWMPPPSTIGECVQFAAGVAGDRAVNIQTTPLIESMCKAAGLGVPDAIPTPVHTAPFSVKLTDMILTEDGYFQTQNADAGMYAKYRRAFLEAQAPWLLARWPDAADLSRAQKRMWAEMTTITKVQYLERAPVVPGTCDINYILSPGWLASMIGSTEICVKVGGNYETVLATPNLERLDGPPMVIRKPTPGNDQDDLSEDTKARAAKEYLDLLSQGLHFRHPPPSLPEFVGKGVKVGNGEITIYAVRTGDVKWRFRGVLAVERHYPRHPEGAPNFEEGQDWMDLRCTGTGVRLNAETEIAALFRSLTPAETRRAIVLMRTYGSRIEITIRPHLYPEDRAVYRLLCAIAYLCPVALERHKMSFTVTDGPLIWSIVEANLSMPPPTHYPWDAPLSFRVTAIHPDRIIGVGDAGRSAIIATPPLCHMKEVEDAILRAMTQHDCISNRANFRVMVDAAVRDLQDIGVISYVDLPRAKKFVQIAAAAEVNRRLITDLAGKFCPEGVSVEFSADCSLCGGPSPRFRKRDCIHVNACTKCVLMDGKHACKASGCGITGDNVEVGEAPGLDVAADLSLITKTRLPTEMFSWQRKALEKLTSFAQPAEVIWLPPGAGKTLILINYIRWCLANNCMTKYVLWSTVQVATVNLEQQCTRADLPIHFLTRSSPNLKPGVVNIVKNSDLATIAEKITDKLTELTFVLDEFHTCMSSNTKRASAAIDIARNAFRTIPMSGTVFKNASSPAELAAFLSLCVKFRLTTENYLVAVGLMVSFRVPSRSVIRRNSICVPDKRDLVEADLEKRLDPMELRMVEDAVKSAKEEEVGVIMCVKNLARAELVIRRLTMLGIRAVGQNSKAPLNFGIDVHPDIRGPGMVAARKGGSPLSSSDAAPALGGIDEDGQANESWRLPQVVIVPLNYNFTTGWDGNRYRRMFSAVTNSNEATRGQMEGRIDRANNNAPYIEYTTYYTEALRGLFEQHEVIRARADALRDAQQSDGVSGRQYDRKERERRQREAEEARERARAEEARQPRNLSPQMVKVHKACGILGITFVEFKSALNTAALKAKRQLNLIWHPDKWVNGTHEEKLYAERFSRQINDSYDIIKAYAE